MIASTFFIYYKLQKSRNHIKILGLQSRIDKKIQSCTYNTHIYMLTVNVIVGPF